MANDSDATEAMYKKRAALYKKLVTELHNLETQKSNMLRDLNKEIIGKKNQMYELADLPLNQTELPLDDEEDQE